MNALLGLLQGEVRMLAAELADAAHLAAEPAHAGEALARWQKRSQALTGAFSVLGRQPWSALAAALQQLGRNGAEGLDNTALAPTLQLLAGFASAPVDQAEAFLDAQSVQATALGEALAAFETTEAASAEDESRPLLLLFRQEIDEQCARMAQMLLRLEQSPDRLDLIAPVMRAAHSVKGAARAVRLDAAVSLAHALEDRLASAQRQDGAVDEALIEYCLGSVDLLRELAHGGATPALLARRDALLAWRPTTTNAPNATPAASAMEPTGAAQPSYIAAEDGDPVLRIKASLVGRLIALAGSGVVSAHRLRPFSQRQQRMRQGIAQLGRLVDDLHHRLGAPSQGTALGAELAELRRQVADTRHQTQGWIDEFADYARVAFDLNERIYHAAALTRLRPFRELVLGYPRMVRDLARQLGKRARLIVVGEALEVDRDVLEQLDAPLTHLLRNALDHGIESSADRAAAGKPEDGQLRIWASHRAGMLAIDVSDDGAGIDLEKVRQRLIDSGRLGAAAAAALNEQALREHLFAAGFSTRRQVSEVSGRGVGLDVVREAVERLDGSVRLSTRLGHGTTFHLLVPVSRAVTRALAVRVAGETYAFPSLRIDRVARTSRGDIASAEGLQYLPLAGRNIGLVPLAELLDLGRTRAGSDRVDVVVVELAGRLAGFVVDDILGEYDLATRPLDTRLGRVADVAAVALLPDGAPVVLLDVDELMRSALTRERAALSAPGADVEQVCRRRVLVADDSISVRELERQLLVARGYEVEVAVDGLDAWSRLREQSFDLLITDVDMPRMDGIELTRSIKQDPRLRALPVVIVSYRDRPEDRRRGLDARADAYLTKTDFQDDSFLKLVLQLVGDPEVRP